MRRTFTTRRAIPNSRISRASHSASWRSRTNTCQAEAWAAAKKAGAWVNVADRPQFCDFIMPAIIDRDPLVIAISTGGASPILGRMLKARLETAIPAAYGRLADLMGGFRDAVGKAIASPIHATPILGDGARGTDRRTRALRRRPRRGRRTHSRYRTRGEPRTPRRRAVRSISSARGPAIPIFSPSAPFGSCKRLTSCSTTGSRTST